MKKARNFLMPKKLVSLLSISTILVALALSVFACGSEPLTSGGQQNTSPVTAAPTATVAPTGAATLTAPIVANSIQYNWLKGIPCRAPCWENITPGKTTPHEAIEILKNNPEFQVPQYSYDKPNNTLTGTIGDRGQAAVIWGFLSFHAEPTPAHIEIIKPVTQPYKLKDIFSLYGEPSHVIAVYAFQEGTQPRTYNVYLVYMSQGLILANTFSVIPTFTPDTTYTEVYFFIPGLEGFSLVNGQADIRADVMVEWQGFKDFKFYCRSGDATVNGIKNCL
jgi:hypothetical protein